MFWFCALFLRLRLFVRHIFGVSSSARGVAGLPERRIANFGVLGSIGTRKLFRGVQTSCTKDLRRDLQEAQMRTRWIQTSGFHLRWKNLSMFRE